VYLLKDMKEVSFWLLVLGLARIGLIFTRSQEKTQLGRLTQTNRAFDTMCHHTGFYVEEQAGGGESWLGSAPGFGQ